MSIELRSYVKRYTTLSSALDTLINRKLVLLSPSKWDDTNDIFFMDLYKKHKDLEAVLALCCTMAAETYHHWRIFTQGMEGVCIELNRSALTESLDRLPVMRSGAVRYLKVVELESLQAEDADDLPFVKRVGYRDEREWRIIADCSEKLQQTLDIPIELSWINRIVLNPWLPPPLAITLRKTIRALPGCAKLKIISSKLTSSDRWKKAGTSLVA